MRIAENVITPRISRPLRHPQKQKKTPPKQQGTAPLPLPAARRFQSMSDELASAVVIHHPRAVFLRGRSACTQRRWAPLREGDRGHHGNSQHDSYPGMQGLQGSKGARREPPDAGRGADGRGISPYGTPLFPLFVSPLDSLSAYVALRRPLDRSKALASTESSGQLPVGGHHSPRPQHGHDKATIPNEPRLKASRPSRGNGWCRPGRQWQGDVRVVCGVFDAPETCRELDRGRVVPSERPVTPAVAVYTPVRSN